MTVQDIMDLALDQTNSSIDDFGGDYTILLKYLNIEYHNIENLIVSEVDEDYFYGLWTTDVVNGSNIYDLEMSTSTQQGIKKVLSVEIKLDDTWQFLNIRKNTDFETPLADLEAQGTEPFYDIKGSRLFIYPTPLENVSDGIKMQALVNLIDLVLADGEDEIFPLHSELRQWQYLLVEGLKIWIFNKKFMWDEKKIAWDYYQAELKMMIRAIKKKYDNTIVVDLPYNRKV